MQSIGVNYTFKKMKYLFELVNLKFKYKPQAHQGTLSTQICLTVGRKRECISGGVQPVPGSVTGTPGEAIQLYKVYPVPARKDVPLGGQELIYITHRERRSGDLVCSHPGLQS